MHNLLVVFSYRIIWCNISNSETDRSSASRFHMFYRERVQSADEWRRDGDDIQRPIHKLLQQPYRTSRRWRVYICLSFTNGFQLPRVYHAIDHDPSLPTPFHELIISSSSIPSLRLLLVIPFLFAAPQDWPRAERREGGGGDGGRIDAIGIEFGISQLVDIDSSHEINEVEERKPSWMAIVLHGVIDYPAVTIRTSRDG